MGHRAENPGVSQKTSAQNPEKRGGKMKLVDIQARAEQKPFRPFAVETTGGSWIDVEKQSDILLPERRPDIVVIFDRSGRMYILDINEISAVEAR
jgi:hypothetical protein